MRLDRVTITGADDSVRIDNLIALSQEFPYVEWGILTSEKHSHLDVGVPRFPGIIWFDELRERAQYNAMNLSLHFCGSWVRELASERRHPFCPHVFQRVQLNFGGKKIPYTFSDFHKNIDEFAGKQVIFQISDGGVGKTLWSGSLGIGILNAAPLFDNSGGLGRLAGEWPAPLVEKTYHGYAGGLGPDNLAEQILRIGVAAGEARIWIDMESKVRSDDNRQFDLAKVRQCLEIAKPFISAE